MLNSCIGSRIAYWLLCCGLWSSSSHSASHMILYGTFRPVLSLCFNEVLSTSTTLDGMKHCVNSLVPGNFVSRSFYLLFSILCSQNTDSNATVLQSTFFIYHSNQLHPLSIGSLWILFSRVSISFFPFLPQVCVRPRAFLRDFSLRWCRLENMQCLQEGGAPYIDISFSGVSCCRVDNRVDSWQQSCCLSSERSILFQVWTHD